MLRKYHPQRRARDEHLGDDIDFLLLITNRIKKGEIKLRKVSQMYHDHKRVVKDILENKDSMNYINNFIAALSNGDDKRQYNAYERLFIKLINLTPMRSNEIINLKCSDFIVKGDYCLVANEYLLFIPLFLEVKSISKDECLFMDRIIKYKINSKRIPKVQHASNINWRVLKRIGYSKVSQNEFAIRLLYYFVNLGLSELAEALTWTKAVHKVKKQLGIPI
ncbi:hypothetical protein KVL94_05045 [Helicobacter pylori]|nr:hypothetical protein KVL94_05045 [Helicobacter pylori]